jgi:hypothetical protein
MGLNVFTPFTGFGLGSLIFSGTLGLGLAGGLALFGAAALVAAAAAIPLFRGEVHRKAP